MLDSHEEALIAIKTIEVGVDTFSLTLECFSTASGAFVVGGVRDIYSM